jgi:hypothetical protein
MLFTSCDENSYDRFDQLIGLEFADVNVDSTALANGFQKAITHNDSLRNTEKSAANYPNISLDYLDSVEALKEKEKPPNVKKKKPKSQDKLYLDFNKAVYEGKIKLGIIDTNNHHHNR